MTPRSGATALALALVLLVGGVAWRWGGYDPFAVLGLEIGAACTWLFVAASGLWQGKVDTEARRARYRAWKRLPFRARHPELADFLRVSTLGLFSASRRKSVEIEILLPKGAGDERIELDPAREIFVLGYPVKRTGLFAPLALVSLWILLSIVPFERGLVGLLSPESARLRSEAEVLVDAEPAKTASLSLAPFLTFESFWLWLALLALFAVVLRLARTPEGASRLGLFLLLLGAASGGVGILGFFSDLAEAYGRADASLRASGSFGNPNHYATFQAMLLLSSLGFLAYLRERRRGTATGPKRGARDDSTYALIAGLGILFTALGLVLSLSRSGIASAFAGALAFVLLVRRGDSGQNRRRTLLAVAAVALAVSAFALWIGIEPVLGRFANLEDQWEREGTRIQVWQDSLPALSDFWLTGSGLSTFRYVGARYRTFGGTIFYSWAHNDYLQLGIELGAPGLLLLAWIGFALVRAARRAQGDLSAAPHLQYLHAGFASAAVSVALHSAADFSLHLPANFALLAVILGGVVGMERSPR